MVVVVAAAVVAFVFLLLALCGVNDKTDGESFG